MLFPMPGSHQPQLHLMIHTAACGGHSCWPTGKRLGPDLPSGLFRHVLTEHFKDSLDEIQATRWRGLTARSPAATNQNRHLSGIQRS